MLCTPRILMDNKFLKKSKAPSRYSASKKQDFCFFTELLKEGETKSIKIFLQITFIYLELQKNSWSHHRRKSYSWFWEKWDVTTVKCPISFNLLLFKELTSCSASLGECRLDSTQKAYLGSNYFSSTSINTWCKMGRYVKHIFLRLF